MGNLTIISETGFPHAACLFEYAEVKIWCGFKPKIPKFPAFWGYVDHSDRAIYIKKFVRFEVPDRTLQEAIAILDSKYNNRWYAICLGIDCIDFAIDAARLCKLEVPARKKLLPCNLIDDLSRINNGNCCK